MKIENIGYYRQRDGDLALVDSIIQDSRHFGEYCVGGELITDIPAVTKSRFWRLDGTWHPDGDSSEFDLIEYLRPELYPEEYL